MTTTKITIHDPQDAESGPLGEVLARIAYYANVEDAQLYVNKRTPDGWLEYLLVLTFVHGGKLTVGAIQRTTDSGMEYHT